MLNKNIARRLIRTEANRFHTQAKIQQWEKMGLKHVKYVAVLDIRTSTICKDLNGSIFPLDSLETGVNCPPMHPWCRSIIQAYFGPVIEFNTTDDPIREVMGSMFESHPEETEKVLKELKDMGIKVFFTDDKKMAYSPGSAEFGYKGHIRVNENASFSALMHERQHALDDIKYGFPGFNYYLDHPKIRWQMEKEAYRIELDIYKRYNVGNKYIKRLKRLIKKEYHKIYPEEMKNDEKTSND